MIRRLACVLSVVLCLAAPASCDEIPAEVRAILTKAEQIEVYSLRPSPAKDENQETFHRYPVLGKVVLKDEKARTTLLLAFEKGVKENEGQVAKCFDPRHGMRAIVDGKTVDLVICFRCMHVRYHMGDKKPEYFRITKSPEPTFDKILTDAGVKLAPKE